MTSRDYLNVRSAPSTAADRVGLLSPGDSVKSTGRLSDGFQEIVFKGATRWASAASLRAVPAAETSASAPATASPDTASKTDATPSATPKAATSATPKATTSATPKVVASKAQSVAKTAAKSATTSTATKTVYTSTAVNLRSGAGTNYRTYGTLAKGATLTTRGTATNGWTPVTYNGRAGWVSTQYLTTTKPAADKPAPTKPATKTVYTSTAVNLRSGAGTNYRTYGTLAKGATLTTRGTATNGWTPVTYNGRAGWVSTQYLTTTKPAADKPAPTKPATKTVYTSTAVNLRSGAGTTYRTYGTLAKGATLTTRGTATNGWTPVTYNGRAGWVSTQYLTTTKPAADKPAPTKPATKTVYTSTAVNLRSGAGTTYRTYGTLAKGATLTTRGTATNGWTPVTYNGRAGWVSTQYLTTTKPATSTGSGNTSSTGKTVYTSTAVNLRSGAGTNYRTYGTLAKGATLTTRGTATNGWTPVTYNGRAGWVSTQYLTTTKPATSTGSGTSSGSSSWASLTAGGSSGLSGLRPNAVGIVNRVLTAFPQIKTIYGVRSDSIDDHPSGHAVDLMLPRGTADSALGQQIANYFRAHASELHVQYIMWNKHIWNISRDSEGWRVVADRGSATANHMDHVHITTVWD
ncbi:SH3 domain-containing protein [Acidipropionibacterium acidipropionici]|uniref:SH3 domain-containing protein n=1 Tax=Acidipropionibacterium acidipropionici TaxID=1748 RepID=UPI001586D941|nr:SH3 domain-containing protein [Acidipropionibacterium acidipropionici]